MDNLREKFINVCEERLKDELDCEIKLLLDLEFEPDILDFINLFKCLYEYRAFLKFKNEKGD